MVIKSVSEGKDDLLRCYDSDDCRSEDYTLYYTYLLHYQTYFQYLFFLLELGQWEYWHQYERWVIGQQHGTVKGRDGKGGGGTTVNVWRKWVKLKRFCFKFSTSFVFLIIIIIIFIIHV